MNPSTSALLSTLKNYGVKLSVVSGNLKLKAAKGKITPKLLDILRDHKTEIINYLTKDADLATLCPTPRNWEKGRIELCQSCGDATGWRTAGKPLCPCCVPLNNPDEYRWWMLSYANEMEKAAIAGEDEKRILRIAVAMAIREALEKDLPEFFDSIKKSKKTSCI